jgi:shikimate kinase
VIVLVGFMGAGKTTVGQLLATRLGLPFTDADVTIAQSVGMPVSQIFAERGEAAFRALEAETIASLLAGPRLVLALGGGAVEHEQTRPVLKAAEHVVYLHVPYEVALDRIGGDDGRPMLLRPDLTEIYRHRLAVYEQVATVTVQTEGRLADHVCADIVQHLAGAQPAR